MRPKPNEWYIDVFFYYDIAYGVIWNDEMKIDVIVCHFNAIFGFVIYLSFFFLLHFFSRNYSRAARQCLWSTIPLDLWIILVLVQEDQRRLNISWIMNMLWFLCIDSNRWSHSHATSLASKFSICSMSATPTTNRARHPFSVSFYREHFIYLFSVLI